MPDGWVREIAGPEDAVKNGVLGITDEKNHRVVISVSRIKEIRFIPDE